MDQPDYQRFPGMRGLRGYECTVTHGETLFMPSGYWHQMLYEEGGFALSLRAFDPSLKVKARGMYNLFVMRNVDNALRRLWGQGWYRLKERLAQKRALATLELTKCLSDSVTK